MTRVVSVNQNRDLARRVKSLFYALRLVSE